MNCIEVAEKVWGWKKILRGKSGEFEYWSHPDMSTMFNDERVVMEVLSWEGFGLTVEAMGKIGLFPWVQATRIRSLMSHTSFTSIPAQEITQLTAVRMNARSL